MTKETFPFKQIKLTNLHETKIAEMCEKLFPDYNFENGDKFHWFEFCMIHLVKKLSEINPSWEDIPQYVQNIYGNASGKWNLYTRFYFHYPKNIETEHPVDYLYKEFKKLKFQ